MFSRLVLTFLMLFSGVAKADLILQSIRSFPDEQGFFTELLFNQSIKEDQVNLTVDGETLSATIVDCKFPKKKVSTFVNNRKRGIRFVEALDRGSKDVVARLVFKDSESLEALKNRVTLKTDKNRLLIKVLDEMAVTDDHSNQPMISSGEVERKERAEPAPLRLAIDGMPHVATNKISSTRSLPVSKPQTNEVANTKKGSIEQTLLATPTGRAEPQTSGAHNSKVGESEARIPLNLNATDVQKSESDPLRRLVLTVIILFVTVAGSVLFLRRTSQNRRGVKNDKAIRVLASHYIGPKKSLLLISIAGETMLLGVTEQNVNLIKTVALLEEELPGQESQSFSDNLQSKVDENDQEDFAMSSVRDVVAKRLKQMRAQ